MRRLLEHLAAKALAAEYDTQEHEDAHNEFCALASEMMSREQQERWDRFCLKATSEEVVSEALEILSGREKP